MTESSRVRLTPGRVAAFTCPDGKPQAFLWDADVKALALRAAAGGRKTYVFQGRMDGRSIRVPIGEPENWTTDAARKRAREIQTEIDNGRDPRQVTAERKAADQTKRQKAKADRAPAIEAWREYLRVRTAKWSARTLLDHERLAAAGGMPKTRGRKTGEGGTTQAGALHDLLQQPLVKINRDAIGTWLESNQHRPTVARFAFVRLRAFMRWCADRPAYRDRVNLDAFTAGAIKDAVPAAGVKHDSLERQHLQAWFEAVRKLENPVHAAYLQVTLLTGARRNEVAAIRWQDVDFRWNQITIHDKVAGQRVIPLTPYVKALLLDLKRVNDAPPNVAHLDGSRPAWTPSPFVFASKTAKAGHIQEPRDGHEKALAAAGLPHVTIHGLRRSFGSLSQWVDIPSGVIPQIMGHKPSATAERHYRVRPVDLLRKWHTEYERWILEQAGIEQPAVEAQQKSITAA